MKRVLPTDLVAINNNMLRWIGNVILCQLVQLTRPELLSLSEYSVVTFTGYQPPLAINHYPFRESVLPNNKPAIFSVNLQPGKYLITQAGWMSTRANITQIKWSIDTKGGRFTRQTNRDIVSTPGTVTQIDGVVFQVPIPTTYRLVGSLGAYPEFNHRGATAAGPEVTDGPEVTYELDGEILGSGMGSLTLDTVRLLPTGIHRLNSWISNQINQYWCVCPSLGNGFVTTHWLGVWPSLPKRRQVFQYVPSLSTGIIISHGGSVRNYTKLRSNMLPTKKWQVPRLPGVR